MATIVARTRADGSIGYTARIRLAVDGKPCVTESRTFSQRDAAVEWAAQRETALGKEHARTAESDSLSLRQLIQSYPDASPDMRGSKRRHLEFLSAHSISSTDPRTLTVMDLVEHIRSRRAEGIGGAIALNEFIWIGVALDAVMTRSQAVRPEMLTNAVGVTTAGTYCASGYGT